MTGTDVARQAHGGQLAITEEERMWNHLIRKANVYANGTMVPPDMRGAPDVVLAGMLMCRRLGFSEDAVPRLDIIEGRLEPPAQMYLGAVHVAGFDTQVLRTDNEACVLSITRPGDTEPLIIEFTIDDAKRAGLLDEWAERWQKTATGKSYKEKFVLGRAGVDVPAWAQAAVRAGETKRMDNWHKWPADMLFAKAAKRAVRRMAPEVLYGLADDVRKATTAVSVDQDDDEIVDGEIVPEPPSGADADAGPGTPDMERPGPASATKLERQLLRSLIDQLDDTKKSRLRALAKEQVFTGECRDMESHHFTGDRAHTLLMLIGQVVAEKTDAAADTPAATGEAANGSGPVEGPGHEAADDDDPGRTF